VQHPYPSTWKEGTALTKRAKALIIRIEENCRKAYHDVLVSCISRVLRDCGKISRKNGLGSLQIRAAKLKHATSGCNKQYVTICHTNKHKYR
jgi:hypothetical protein